MSPARKVKSPEGMIVSPCRATAQISTRTLKFRYSSESRVPSRAVCSATRYSTSSSRPLEKDSSGLFLGIHFAAYFGALRATSIASAVVLVDTEVFFVAAASALFLGQRLPRRTWPAVLLAFAGSAVVALADSAAGTNALLGDLIALAGAAAMAVYTMIGTVCRQRLSTSVYTFLVYTSAAATLLAAALLSGTPLAGYGPVNGLTALGMAVCCTLLGHNVFSWGLKYLPPAFIATVKLMEPVFASVWGLLLFGERPGWLTVAGGAAVLLGVGLYARTIGGDAGKREEREP